MRGCLFRQFECFFRVLVGLLGELVSGEMVAFAVGGGCGSVGVGGFVVVFGGAVVRALRHDSAPWLLDADHVGDFRMRV